MPLEDSTRRSRKRFADATGSAQTGRRPVSEETLSLLDDMVQVNSKGGVQPAEAFTVHRDLLSRRADAIDPNVRVRLERARNISAADYIDMVRQRARLIRAMDARLADLDVLVHADDADCRADHGGGCDRRMSSPARMRCCLRNTVIANFFDLCAISLPMPREGGLPTGLMLVARNGQ